MQGHAVRLLSRLTARASSSPWYASRQRPWMPPWVGSAGLTFASITWRRRHGSRPAGRVLDACHSPMLSNSAGSRYWLELLADRKASLVSSSLCSARATQSAGPETGQPRKLEVGASEPFGDAVHAVVLTSGNSARPGLASRGLPSTASKTSSTTRTASFRRQNSATGEIGGR